MNDFFSVLDDFEIQEFVAADESDYTGSSFSIDSFDDTSQVDPEQTEFTDVALNDVLSDKTDVTTTDNSEYVWRNGENPFSGTTTGVYAGYSNYVQKNDGGDNENLQYREVTLSMTSGLSFTRTIAETAPLKVDSTDVAIAGTAGINVDFYNLIISIVVAVIIVLSMSLVGSLLISAFIIFPALSAMKLFKTFRAVTICSVMLSVICAFVGIIASILAGTPVGSTIVAVEKNFLRR